MDGFRSGPGARGEFPLLIPLSGGKALSTMGRAGLKVSYVAKLNKELPPKKRRSFYDPKRYRPGRF
jgi:hypothetical protein